MSNNLGFEYVLSVNEQATKTNLNTFIKNFFGEKGKAKLSVPIKLDITDGISDINLDKVQRDINRITKDALKVKAKVDLQIDTKAINTLTNTVEVMQTLNKEVDKLKDGMKELGKSLTINFGNISLDGQLDGVLETSKKINEENKSSLIHWIYKIRYYRFIPINNDKCVKDLNCGGRLFVRYVKSEENV